MIDRVFTKAEARCIPNGPRLDDRHGPSDPDRRPRRVLLSRRTSSTRRRRARSSRRRTSSASTATCRTSRISPRTSTCGRRSWPAARASREGEVTARSIDLAPTLAFLLGIPEPQHSQGRVLLDVVDGGNVVQADLARRAERLPRPARPDDARLRRDQPDASAGPRSSRRCSTRSSPRCPARRSHPRRRRQRRRLAAELAACSRTGRRSTSRTRGASTRPRTATTSSTTASSGSSSTRSGRTSRSSRRTSSTTATGRRPAG